MDDDLFKIHGSYSLVDQERRELICGVNLDISAFPPLLANDFDLNIPIAKPENILPSV